MNIAMWTCARSRSTLLLRAFQQHERCLAIDEPLYAPYLVSAGFDHPNRDAIIAHHETDYDAVIRSMTGALHADVDFSFQKHTANNLPTRDDRGWLDALVHVFLIRSPDEILLSRQAIYGTERTFSMHEVGLVELHALFDEIRERTGQVPIVVDSGDVIRDPRGMLGRLCAAVGVPFSESMLSWPRGLRADDPIWAPTWYGTLLDSTGFLPPSNRPVALPEHLQAAYAACLPHYETLYDHRLR